MRKPSLGWTLSLSAYWFSTSFKWFIILIVPLLSDKVKQLVPGGEESAYWGLIVTIGGIEACIGPAIVGFISDRTKGKFGKRHPYLIAGMLGTLASLYLLSTADTIAEIVIGYLLLQISDDIGTAPYAALVPELVAKEHRGYASGVMGFLQQIAQVAAIIVAVLFIKTPNSIWIATAAVNVIGALLVVGFVRERRPQIESEPKPIKDILKTWIEPWKIPDFRWVWFTRFLNAAGLYPIVLFSSYYFESGLKMSNEDATKFKVIVAFLLSLGAAIASVFAGRLADRFGRKKVVYASGWIMFCSLVPFSLLPYQSAVLVLVVLFSVGYGAYVSADWALASDIMPNDEDFARDMGMWAMSVPLGQATAGLLGPLVPLFNSWSGDRGYQVLWFLCAFIFLFSATLIKKVKGST